MLLLYTLLACEPDKAVSLDSAAADTADPGDTGEAPDVWRGTGADGALDVANNLDFSTVSPSYGVVSISGDTLVLSAIVTGLASGDEVMILNVHGSDDDHDNVGHYAFATVASFEGVEVQLRAAPTGFTTDDQSLVLVRVPNYTDVTVSARLYTPAWNGRSGGVVVFRASGSVSLLPGGSISADGRGYLGGLSGLDYNQDGYQGESYAGTGDGNAPGTNYNEAYAWYAGNWGGGGANVTGGGGEYGGGATAADAWYPGGPYTAPEAGDVYGEPELSALYFGSGGGGVWNDGSFPGPGGAGGGIVYVAADSITASEPHAITARGETTDSSSQGSWSYGAGGGAGGSIYLIGNSVTLAAESVVATGGLGTHDVDQWGGDGGVGRIRVDATLVPGVSLRDATEPDAFAGAP